MQPTRQTCLLKQQTDRPGLYSLLAWRPSSADGEGYVLQDEEKATDVLGPVPKRHPPVAEGRKRTQVAVPIARLPILADLLRGNETLRTVHAQGRVARPYWACLV